MTNTWDVSTSMSATATTTTTTKLKMPVRCLKDDSAELDVFEAARYFTENNELKGSGFTALPRQQFAWRTRRMSLDGSTIRPEFPTRPVHQLKPNYGIEKQEKLPRSPGGRLASFLNSLFNQSSSRKKKSKNPSSEPVKDNEDDQRRKRRSSISHFRSSAAPTEDSVTTPTKSYKDLRSYSVSKTFIRDNMDVDYCGEKVENKCMVRALSSEVKEEEDDGGAESDSSSDLFELKNYDIGPGHDTGCRSDLPVYETTRLDRIKVGSTTISIDQCF